MGLKNVDVKRQNKEISVNRACGLGTLYKQVIEDALLPKARTSIARFDCNSWTVRIDSSDRITFLRYVRRDIKAIAWFITVITSEGPHHGPVGCDERPSMTRRSRRAARRHKSIGGAKQDERDRGESGQGECTYVVVTNFYDVD